MFWHHTENPDLILTEKYEINTFVSRVNFFNYFIYFNFILFLDSCIMLILVACWQPKAN